MKHLNISPVIVGELHYTIPDGCHIHRKKMIQFSNGLRGVKGQAYIVTVSDSHYRSVVLMPITKSNGEPLIFEGYSELFCTYDDTIGTLKDFYEL